jgi:hypothetical protein
MEPLFIILVPGLAGGLVLALLIASNRRKAPSTVVSRRLAEPSTAMINMASIRVEGIGGLGMVAAVAAVAITDPRIRLAIIIAWVLGAVLALSMIAIRRRTGALPSGGDGPDNGSLLHLDDEGRRGRASVARATLDRLERVGAPRAVGAV